MPQSVRRGSLSAGQNSAVPWYSVQTTDPGSRPTAGGIRLAGHAESSWGRQDWFLATGWLALRHRADLRLRRGPNAGWARLTRSRRLCIRPLFVWRVDQPASVGGHPTEVLGAPRVVPSAGAGFVEFDGTRRRPDRFRQSSGPACRQFTIEVLGSGLTSVAGLNSGFFTCRMRPTVASCWRSG